MTEMKKVNHRNRLEKPIKNMQSLILLLDPAEIELCCDVDQIISMVDSIALTSSFARCPSCVKNLIGNICEFSCSPNQYKFLFDIKLSEENGNLKEERKYINLQNYLIKNSKPRAVLLNTSERSVCSNFINSKIVIITK